MLGQPDIFLEKINWDTYLTLYTSRQAPNRAKIYVEKNKTIKAVEKI